MIYSFKMLGAVASTLVLAGPVVAQNLTLATGATGGSYYPIGVQISTIVTEEMADEGLRLSPISTGGSAENVDLIDTGEAQMAILMGLYGRDGYMGTGVREGRPKVEKLRSIASLWQNVEQFVVRKSKIKSGDMSDMGGFGSQFVIGPRNSGTEGASRLLLNANGINPDEAFSVLHMKYDVAAEAFQNGRVDGMYASSGVPTPSIAQAYVTSGEDVSHLNITDEQMAKVNAIAGDMFTRFTIPAGTYQGQTEPIQTIKEPNLLAVSADVPEETVYQITRLIFANLERLHQSSSVAKEIQLETALDGLPVPLHPGAIRFYDERGIAIPDRLRP